MKKCSTFLLRLTVFIAGVVMLAICGGVIWLAIDTSSTSVYYYLAYALMSGVCLAAIPYFIALYHTYKLLGYIDANCAFSTLSSKSLSIITRCAVIVFMICSIVGLPVLYLIADIEDAPGLIIIGLVIAGVAFIISVFASVLNRLLQEVIEMKSENELTI